MKTENLAIALVAMCLGMGGFVACSDDADGNVGTAGSAGTGGSAGSAGNAGTGGGTAGSAGVGNAGSAGSAGAATAGSAGEAGSGGGGTNGGGDADAGADASSDSVTDAGADAGLGEAILSRCQEICSLAAAFVEQVGDAGGPCAFYEEGCNSGCGAAASQPFCQAEFLAYEDCLVEENNFACVDGNLTQAGCNTESAAYQSCSEP